MTEDDFDEGMVCYQQIKRKFACVRFVNRHIVGSTINLVIDYMFNPEAEAEEIMHVWRKFNFYIDNLEQIVIVSAANQHALSLLIDTESQTSKFENSLMLTPEEPTEDHIGALLLAKLNAIGANAVAFGVIAVEATESQGMVVTVSGIVEAELPNMSEWMGPYNWFTMPWWLRDDGSTLDAFLPEDGDKSEIPEWAYSFDFLRDKPKPAGIILNPGFKPRLVKSEPDGE